MADGDEFVWTGRETRLARAMDSLRGDIAPLYNAGCCLACGYRKALAPCRSSGGDRGYVFWHDGEIERAAKTGVLNVTFGAYSPGIVDDIWGTVANACRLNRMFTVHTLGSNHSEVWLTTEDRRWFEERWYDLEEERYLAWRFRAEPFVRLFRLGTVLRAFRRGLRELEAERERAARLIADAVTEWACRPGGACARLAQRSFADVSASGTR